jgi:CysZ protein
MIKDYQLAFNQINDHRFWKPVLWSTLLASIVLFIFFLLGSSTSDWIFDYLVSYFNFLEEESWIRSFIKIIIIVFLLIMGFFFFGFLQAGFLGLFIDDIIDAIKEKHYPHIELKPAPKIHTSIVFSLRLIFLSFVVNLMATPIFILGWFFPPLGFCMQIFLNGYLLGKEYRTTVDYRLPNESSQKNQTFILYGSLGTAIWIIPILNWFAPILVCASIFHARVRALESE